MGELAVSHPKYLTVVYAEDVLTDPSEVATAAAEAAGLDYRCDRKSEQKSKLTIDNKTIHSHVRPAHSELHQHKVDMSIGESGAPEVWDSDEESREFFDHFVEFLCQLAIQLDAEYVALLQHAHWAEVIPSDVPLAENIDRLPQLAIYSESLLHDLGGIEAMWDRTPWRVGDLENGSTLIIWSAEPWCRSGWTDSYYRDLRAPQSEGESDGISEAGNSDQELRLSDPVATLSPGDYGVDACVAREDIAAEFRNEDLQMVRVYVDDDRNLRRMADDTFVRNVVTEAGDDEHAVIEGMLADIQPDADDEAVMISALLHGAVPPSFVRLASDGENVVSRVLELDIETNKIALLVSLGEAARHGEGLDTQTIESALGNLDDIDDPEVVDTYIRENLL